MQSRPDAGDRHRSHVYRTTAGYCDTLRATGPVAGLPYQPARDT